MEFQGTPNNQNMLKNKNKLGVSHFPISKLTAKSQLSKQYSAERHMYIDQQNRTERLNKS